MRPRAAVGTVRLRDLDAFDDAGLRDLYDGAEQIRAGARQRPDRNSGDGEWRQAVTFGETENPVARKSGGVFCFGI